MVGAPMSSSVVRYLALGALVAGLATIAWTALSDGDSDGSAADTAATTSTQAVANTGEDAAAGVGVPAGSDASAGDDGSTGSSDPSAAPESASGDEPAVATTATDAPEPIPVLKEADTLTGLDGWLNASVTSLEEIRAANQITVVQFWTFGCRNCKNTLEALGRLYDDFGDRGVEIVGVHSPEFSYEADVDNIIEAAAELNVTWPIALDTNKRNFHRWQEGAIAYWPRVYVIDSDNQVRFDRTGDGRATYELLYATVEQLLADA